MTPLSLFQSLIQMMKVLNFNKRSNKLSIHQRDEMPHHLSNAPQFKDAFYNRFHPMGVFLLWIEKNDFLFEFSPSHFFPILTEKSINLRIEETQFE